MQHNIRTLLILLGLTTPELRISWWYSYNKSFCMSPSEQYQKDKKVVLEYLNQHISGEYS